MQQQPVSSVKQLPILSAELQNLLKSLADKFTNLRDTWEQIKLKGSKEGFSEHQLAHMLRHYLKERGLSKDKIYYLFHKEDQKEQVKNRKFKQIYGKNDPVKISKTIEDAPEDKVVHFKDVSPTAIIEHHSSDQVQEVEFDLIQALDVGLKDAITRAENSKSQVCTLKVYVKDGIVERIVTKCDREVYMYDRVLSGGAEQSDGQKFLSQQ